MSCVRLYILQFIYLYYYYICVLGDECAGRSFLQVPCYVHGATLKQSLAPHCIVELIPTTSHQPMTPVVQEERCFGSRVCVSTCKLHFRKHLHVAESVSRNLC